jgi:type II secretory pathway pseudopilin PulG
MKSASLGASLLELLLALSIIGVIIILGIQRYQSYQQLAQIAEVKTDLQEIFNALNIYFYINGCQQNGDFKGSLAPDLDKDLNLGKLKQGHSPFIYQYKARLEIFGNRKSDGKPLYQFIIRADMTPLSHQQLNYWLGQTHGFDKDDRKNQLQWRLLPRQELYQPNQNWIFAQRINAFKRKFQPQTCAQ